MKCREIVPLVGSTIDMFNGSSVVLVVVDGVIDGVGVDSGCMSGHR